MMIEDKVLMFEHGLLSTHPLEKIFNDPLISEIPLSFEREGEEPDLRAGQGGVHLSHIFFRSI